MKTRHNGFTLIELLVVIAIIAVLMGILMPSLRAARDQGRRMRCMSNIRNLAMGWYMYQDDNDSRLVNGNVPKYAAFAELSEWFWVEPPQDEDGTYTGDPSPTEQDEIRGIERGALYPFIKNHEVYRCPSDWRKRHPGNATYRSYSIPGNMNGEEHESFEGRSLQKFTQIKNASTKYIFVEEAVQTWDGGATGQAWNMGSWLLKPTGSSWVDPLCVWHNNRSTLGFADGHAEVHRWVDERTIEMSEEGKFNAQHEGSEDLKYMQERFQLRTAKSSRRTK